MKSKFSFNFLNIFLSSLLIFSLISCSEEKPRAYTYPEKAMLSVVAVAEGNQKKLSELENNYQAWKKLAEKGDEQAKKETQEWQKIKTNIWSNKEGAESYYEDAKDWLEKNK